MRLRGASAARSCSGAGATSGRGEDHEPDADEAEDDAGQGQAVAALTAPGLPDLGAGDEAENDGDQEPTPHGTQPTMPRTSAAMASPFVEAPGNRTGGYGGYWPYGPAPGGGAPRRADGRGRRDRPWAGPVRAPRIGGRSRERAGYTGPGYGAARRGRCSRDAGVPRWLRAGRPTDWGGGPAAAPGPGGSVRRARRGGRRSRARPVTGRRRGGDVERRCPAAAARRCRYRSARRTGCSVWLL